MGRRVVDENVKSLSYYGNIMNTWVHNEISLWCLVFYRTFQGDTEWCKWKWTFTFTPFKGHVLHCAVLHGSIPGPLIVSPQWSLASFSLLSYICKNILCIWTWKLLLIFYDVIPRYVLPYTSYNLKSGILHMNSLLNSRRSILMAMCADKGSSAREFSSDSWSVDVFKKTVF